jgi:hypothetical protein
VHEEGAPDARIERLLGEIERSDDPEAQARARGLVDAVLAWHRRGLARVLEIALARGGEGRALVDQLTRDPMVESLLALHELFTLPPSTETLVPVERLVAGAAEAAKTSARSIATDTCETCGVGLGAPHEHLYEPASRALRCSCGICACVEASRAGASWKRVLPRAEVVLGLTFCDADWERLCIPIDLAFFQRSSAESRTLAFYPSPAGAVESEIAGNAWDEVARANPKLLELQPDVEAHLIHRVGGAREHYLVSIDRAYELVGQLRHDWRGLSGGVAAWRGVASFFERLKACGGCVD